MGKSLNLGVLWRFTGLVFLLVFWVLGGACQRHGVGEFIVQFIIISVLWRFVAFCDKQFSGRSGTVRPQALLGLVAGLLVRFWRGLWSWLAHVDPSRRGSRACFARVAQSPFTAEWVPVSTTRWHAATSEGESQTARAPLQRSSSRIPRGGGSPIPVGRQCSRLRNWVALATANGQARE